MKPTVNAAKSVLAITIALSLYACGGGNSTEQTTPTTEQPTTTTPTTSTNQGESQQGLAAAFPKHTSVFGVQVRATEQVDNAKMLHAANILAEYLDNNDDGLVDNQQVVDTMVARNATLVMAKDEAELNSLQEKVGDDVDMDSL